MSLYIRMVLYAFFAGLASMGIVDFDPVSEEVSFTLKSLEAVIIGGLGYLTTFVIGRVVKHWGWAT